MAIAHEQVDVVVWGGGTGGVAAALQAARGGADTLLLTPGAWLGGMVSAAGVCCPDGNELSPWQTGLWGAFLRELQRREPGGLDHNWVSCFGYRPATAEAVLRDWCRAEPRLRWWPSTNLAAIRRRGARIEAIELCRGERTIRLDLQLLIDGSDRGDTFALADVPFRFGWEAQEQWGEPSAPSRQRLETEPFFRQQPVQSPTWVVMGQLAADRPPGSDSAGPHQPLPAPFTDAAAAFGLERTITYGRLPGGLVMLNWPLHGNDWHQGLGELFGPDPQRRQAVYGAMRAHSQAFAAALQAASGGWLRAAACFPSHGARDSQLSGADALALMPYWREGRRLVGRELVREQDLLPQAAGASIAPPSRGDDGQLSAIAVGNYANDHHYPGPDWPLAPKSCRWGGRWSGTPFTIPYGALVSAVVDNLLAADKGTSTSHMANGATRLQPLILNTGQAAGAAAALCIRIGCLPAELAPRLLQETLIGDALAPAGPMPLWDTPWHHPDWAARQRAALQDPALLGPGGSLQGWPACLDPAVAPAEPAEQLLEGELRCDGEGGYRLQRKDGLGDWQLITLEPAMHHWLAAQQSGQLVALIGCCNPWGPWLRVSRLA